MTTRFKDLHSEVEKRVGFASKEVARLDAKVMIKMQEQDASVAKSVQLSLEL